MTPVSHSPPYKINIKTNTDQNKNYVPLSSHFEWENEGKIMTGENIYDIEICKLFERGAGIHPFVFHIRK